VTGIDVGLKVLLITADGQIVGNPRHDRKAEKQLQQAQQRVSRRTKGSKRRAKAVKQLAKRHQHMQQRSDLYHKTALALVRRYNMIYYEAIQPAKLSRRPAPIADPDGTGGYVPTGASRKAGLNKSIQDAGWSAFLSILDYTAACAGKRAEAVDPAFTTQDCSNARPDGTIRGERVSKSLSVRTHVCPRCGGILDRDLNPAKNIHWRGQRLRGVPAVAGALNREPVGR
jgi:putative transposase